MKKLLSIIISVVMIAFLNMSLQKSIVVIL